MSFFTERVRRFAGRWKRTSASPGDDAAAPLSCREFVELATAYFDGALPPPDRSRFDAHLAACDGCTRYLDHLRKTIAVTGTLREDDIDPETREQLLDAFRGWRDGG